jgi:hypothetical protein
VGVLSTPLAQVETSLCFENKKLKHPVEVLSLTCAYMKLWTRLYKTDFQEQLASGIQSILTGRVPTKCWQTRGLINRINTLRIEDTNMEGEDEESQDA